MTSLFVPAHSHLEPTDQAFTSVVLSRQGLDFLKDLLINKAVSSIIPLKLPKIEKSVRIPFVGSVHMVLSDTTIYKIDVSESYVKPGDAGIVIIVSGATCNLSMNWYYSYSTWLVPVEISDTGSASVQVWLRLLEFVANF
jgi:lipopolysaccharide-binding protein